MAITRNLITAADIDKAFVGPTWCFPAVKSDDNYLEDPYYSGVVEQEKALVAAAISLSAAGDIKVELWNKRVITIPSGTLIPGVRYPLPVVKVWDTGTDAIDVLIWQGESLLSLKKNPEPVNIGSIGSSGTSAPLDATYIVQTANGTLTNEQALSSLTTGVVKVTNGTGALSTATAGTDYVSPGGALGTPSSGTLTNCTGLPISSGVSGLGTGIATFLATPSSANLASAITDETGTAGKLVFDTTPTFQISITITGGTVTASTPVIDSTQTWNSSGVTFTAWKLNVTSTASASGSLLCDMQVGGSSKFSVDKTGIVAGTRFNAGTFGDSGGSAFTSGFGVIRITLGWAMLASSDDCGWSRSAAGELMPIKSASGTDTGAFRCTGLRTAVVSKTSTYTATTHDRAILVDASGGAVTINLPAAASHTGREYTIKKTDSSGNAVTIDPNSSETVDGSATLAISTQYAGKTVKSDGTNWHVVGSF